MQEFLAEDDQLDYIQTFNHQIQKNLRLQQQSFYLFKPIGRRHLFP